ncbi:ABC transporter ATP-binding protein [Streptomyces sp. BK205]|uniref:ABC transporter ATP-binding protein n=1 Tax=Streptomyces sp. BK205 TaxID=2512164 RepID=UPI00104ECCD2|nr:ABC transporter ATP-binding protein [Streptomyces sp. BK205]TCR16027.1 ATP-binding cassette subfamily B protein [Streptomyces sp. BK205]
MGERFVKAMSALRERRRTWERLAAALPRAGWPLLTAAVVVAVVRGLLSVTFIVSMGYVLRELGVQAGRDAAGTLQAAGTGLVLAFGAFGLQQLISPLQAVLTMLMGRRLDGADIRDLMSAAIRAPLSLTERQETITTLTTTTVNFLYIGLTPGKAAAALLPLTSRYLELAAAVAVIGVTVSWPVAVPLAVAALVLRFAQRGSLGRYSRYWNGLAGERQKIFYLQTIGTHNSSAKEMRALKLAPWLTERYERDNEAYLRPLWSLRRAVYLAPFVGYSLLGYLIAVLAFSAIAWQSDGQAQVLGLAVAVQAVLIPLRFGAEFPECDAATQYGAQASDELDGLHRKLALSAPGARGEGAISLQGPPTVRFHDVSFGYPGGEPVLAGLDLTLRAGTSTAVVGVNGAGKTTLVKQLCGLYTPDKGKITVDGHDLKDLDLAVWRRHVAVILQDFVQYETTLRDNVAFGAAFRAVDEDALQDAIDRSGTRGVVDSLPDGVSTILSPAYEGGVDLSGGQWQRVALARALYAVNMGARVLVLDEPTAQLDVRSEAAFFEQFMELTAGLTTLVISHRFSTVRRAEAIAVLAKGQVTEYGRHEELMAAEGTYAEMFRLQADKFAGAPAGEEEQA